jgi:integrase
MRQSEILNLRTAQVDLTSRVARLKDTKNNSARTVPLTIGAASAFKAAIENPLRPKTSDLIFLANQEETECAGLTSSRRFGSASKNPFRSRISTSTTFGTKP